MQMPNSLSEKDQIIRRRCKCKCNGITNPGNKYILGHNNKKHGLSHHKLHIVWTNIKQRCYNPNIHNYQNYGARGIRICIRWRKNFKSFYNWAIINGYKEGLEIDRRDNNKNYTPSNCRFVNHRINNLNQRIRKDNSSGYRGVCFIKNRSKYMAYFAKKYIGLYLTSKQAAIARDKYIIENNLPNKLNFPKDKSKAILAMVCHIEKDMLLCDCGREKNCVCPICEDDS